MSITRPGTIPQEELLPNAGKSRSGRSTGTRCARKIGNTSVSRRVGRAHWRASSARAISRGSPLARTVKSAPMSGRRSASLLSTDTSTWALLSLRLTWMQSRTQLGVVSIQQSPWRLGGAIYANMLLGRIHYVGKAYAFNKVHRQYRLVEHLDQGAFGSWSCAHLMDRPLPDLHPSGWA